jgi:hypothetical protein
MKASSSHYESEKVLELLGIQKLDEVPEHRWEEIQEQTQENAQELRDRESPKDCILLKSCEPLYTCPRSPFYREAKGLLHSEIALGSKEYSKWEHVHECLLDPVICRANFIHLQAGPLFTP